MATKTAFLQLLLPLNNEYQNIWDQPLNANFTKIDQIMSDMDTELINARGSAASLGDFLAVGHDQGGNLLPSPEVIAARQSFSYGDTDSFGDLDLHRRINLGDREIFDAREGSATLRAALAFQRPSYIFSGAKNVNGYPTWMGFTGANIQVDGSVNQLVMLIDGYTTHVRTLSSVTVSGVSGTRYLWAQFQSGGITRVDGDTTTPPPTVPSGVASSDGSKVTLFSDATVDFTTQDVKAGDILRIVGAGTNAGDYLIKTVAPGGNPNAIQIYGYFPGGALASLNYFIIDSLAVTLGVDTTETPTTGKLYIGEADFDGVSVTAVRPRHFKNTFVSEWRAEDVSGGSPTFEEIFNHRLGTSSLDVVIQVSQANDDSQPVEELSLAGLTDTQALSFSNTLSFSAGTFNAGSFSPGVFNAGSFSAGTFNPGSSGATYSPLPSQVAPSYTLPSMTLPSYSPLPSLSGTVTSSLTGVTYMDRSVAVKYTKNQIYVKNVRSALFYRDYGGVVRQSGFLRVIVQKRT